MSSAPLLVFPDYDSVQELGGKARSLAALMDAGLPVPRWFAVAPAALAASLPSGAAARLATAATPAEAAAALVSIAPSDELQAVVLAAAQSLAAPDGKLAIRSSAADEDSDQHSYAGQLASYLDVPVEEVPARIADVWRSGFSERVFAYRRERGLAGPPAPPAVIVQRMVAADAAGVAFSADPVSGQRKVAVVAAVRGLGETLVSGEAAADTYHVSLDGSLVERSLLDELEPILPDHTVQAIAALARRAAAHFNRPQDIEWATESGRLYLLQSRPITALAALPDPDGTRRLWDNSNIVESYGGVTTPLTYSFARRAYEMVYREFCRLLGVPEATITAQQSVFACMIGLIDGRIYYNLLNWYRVLALLPGFRTNRRFMEGMMGVKEGLPAELVHKLETAGRGERWTDRLRLVRTLLGLLRSYLTLGRRKRAFAERLQAALGSRPALADLGPDELVSYYRSLDAQLLTHWDAPLINDFFAMVFYGLLRRLCTTWCGDVSGSLQNDLLAGEGGMISAEPALRVRALAELASADPALAELLTAGSGRAIEAALAERPAFAAALQDYLTAFGDRCSDELKLESATLHDDPLPLLRAVGNLAARLAVPLQPASDLRRAAEARVQKTLARQPLRRWAFLWVVRGARLHVRDRENLRFERTRVFGRARQIFVELGRRFYALDRIDEPRDIFYLELDEILGFVEGTATTTDLGALVRLRRRQFAAYNAGPALPERFETAGVVYTGGRFVSPLNASAGVGTPVGDTLRGLGCCPGVVRGRARRVSDPRGVALAPGDILVAERTDPSWVLVMPAAAGILVERGSLLSHTAIVARELGIPTVVALDGLTRWLREGETVEFDGSTGMVRKIPGAHP